MLPRAAPLLACVLLLLPDLTLAAIGQPPPTAGDVRVEAGLPDAVTNVGQVFVYSVPPNAFAGAVRSVQIKEATGETIPTWLNWDESRRQLIGVPFDDSVGPLHLSVTASGPAGVNGPQATDVFTVKVKEEFVGGKSNYANSFCSHEEPTVTLALLLDTEFEASAPLDRVRLLEKASRLFDVDVSELRLHPSAYEAALKRNLLAAGPGRAEDGATRTGGVQLLWKIGCGGELSDSLSVYVSKVERKVADGSVAGTLGYPVAGWQVATVSRSVLKHRRQLANYYRDPFTYNRRSNSNYRAVSAELGGGDLMTTQDYRFGWWHHGATSTPRPRVVPTTTTTRATTTTTTTTRRPTPAPTTRWTRPPPPTADRITSRRTTRQSIRVTSSIKRTRPTTAPSVVRRPDDEKPRVINSLTSFVCYRGVVCHLRIPQDTFLDKEDGDTYQLRLELSPIDEGSRHWMFLDKRGRHALGFINDGPRSWHYRLSATDSNGQMVSTAFVIQVVELSDKQTEFSHEFTMTLDMDYSAFVHNYTKQVHFLRRLGRALGDSNAKDIIVHSITEGSTIITWSNKSLPTDDCLETKVNGIRNQMLLPNGEIRRDFQRSLGREYRAQKITLQLKGACLTNTESKTPKIKTNVNEANGGAKATTPNPDGGRSGSISGDDDGDDLLVSTLLPIAIIALLLLAALIIACLFYCRKKRDKLGASKDAKSEYVSKGLPVVFPEEVQDDRELSAVAATTPMLIKEERGPLPPPPDDYRPSMTPGRGESAQPMMPNMYHASSPTTTEHENPLYKPPPPMDLGGGTSVGAAGSASRSPRPKHTLPHQREPPPYVPP